MPNRLLACAIALLLLAPSLAEAPSKKSTPALPPPGMAMCLKAPDRGPCKAAMERYYFDPETGTCKAFMWGGCQGSVPFETMEACKDTCVMPKN